MDSSITPDSIAQRDARITLVNPTRTQTLLLLCLLTAVAAAARVFLTLADPGFDAVDARGLLRSDPAILFHFVQSILDAGGWPAEFANHARIEAPEPMSISQLFALGPEFAVASFHALFGAGQPLHISCLWFSSIAASSAAFGIALIARECGLSRSHAIQAALLALLLPGTERTMGFLLVGEDYSFPAWLLHIGLGLRAARTRSTPLAVASAFALLIALSTWHAASFFLGLEAVIVFAYCWRRQLQPLATSAGRIALATVMVGSLMVPMLRHTALLLSVPMALALSMAVGTTRWRTLAIAAAVWLSGLIWASTSGAGSGEYSHVFALLLAKAQHFLQLPADPREVPFEVRIMWQGPFASLSPLTLMNLLGIGTLSVLLAAKPTWRAWSGTSAESAPALVATLFFAGLALSLAIERVVILPAALAAILLVHALQARGSWLAVGIAAQLLASVFHYSAWRNPWYQPIIRREELKAAIAAVERLTPADGVIATDFVNGPAILAHTGRAILMQPKWETRRSRERIEEFLHVYFRGNLADLRRLMESRGARYLLVDRATLTMGMRYSAGIPPGQALPAGSPAALLGSFDGSTPSQAPGWSPQPGWEVLYESPRRLVMSDGKPSILFRLYKLN